MLEVESMATSFATTMRMCEIASKAQTLTHCFVLGRHVFAAPGDNPHLLYSRYFSEMVREPRPATGDTTPRFGASEIFDAN